ncbi:hypothetical protein [Aureliella helgolandensis]|uniref:Uncharacterized protein n=1 Tax=Aureliella helgolandensis TaxID=2527968 RepID=A0A518GCS4_9BACT|nr:hypothetical protein [Aureliella helgolandensis]QDV26394.1 hypothetical protein Q31a_47680 [Aureliella helgolandensis]
MLMRNPEYKTVGNLELDVSSDGHSPAAMLLGQIVLLLLFVVAIMLRSLSG